MRPRTHGLALALTTLLAGCVGRAEPDADALDLVLRMGVPGQACLDQGFEAWLVEVRSDSSAGPLVASATIAPFSWPIDGESVGQEDGAFVFGDYWVGVLPAGDYHVRAVGLTDPGPPPVVATFMTPGEAMATLQPGYTTEVVLVTTCDGQPGALDVIVVVDGGPRLLDFDVDEKWVAVCQSTTFTATIANPEHLAATVRWTLTREGGAVVLSDEQVHADGAPDPIVASFVAWTPEPGDYEGTLEITIAGSTSVFSFPWHVRVPGIAIGACLDQGQPTVLLSCDASDGYDGLPLADDATCLDEAWGASGGVLPDCADVFDEVCGDDYPCEWVGPDGDGDNVPDVCDPCPLDPLDDSDFDGVCDGVDQCPGEPDVDDDANGEVDCQQCPTTNCTWSQGFWKTHPEAWPVSTLTFGGRTWTQGELLTLMGTPAKGDARIVLAHQYVAAMLGAAWGADTSAVADTLVAARTWLDAHWNDRTNPSGPVREKGLALANVLEQFATGQIGPGHCDDRCAP